CPDGRGRRYRDEVLEIRREGADGRRCSIADVLGLTVTEARAFFADAPEVAVRLAPLADVGLEYVKLGQPVPTLSGGEAQRLKLAGHLAEAGTVLSSTTHRGKLFLFDEPTTGLHFEDVAKLLRAFRKLLSAGHSLLVIEHNLDVIRAADWIIDLGTEGGARGGEILCAGTPQEIRAEARSYTGQALPAYDRSLGAGAPGGAPSAGQEDPRLRHSLQRGPAALCRVAERLCPPVRAAGRASRRGRDLRHPADGGHRAAHQPRRPQEHRGDAHRDLSLPAAALREARHAVLPRLRHRDPAAEPRFDRRTAAARVPREAHHAARAARRGAQGLLHRPRPVGGEEGLPDAACRWGVAADLALAAPVALPRAHHRAAGGADRGRRPQRSRAPRRARPRARFRQGPGTRAGIAGGPGDGVLHQARLPL